MNIIKRFKSSIIYLQLVVLLIALSIGFTGCSNSDSLVSTDASSGNDSISDKIVLIDPGHGGADPGAIYTDNNGIEIEENNVNFEVSLLLRDMLKESGVNVEITRQEDQEISLEDRKELAENKNVSLLVSVHLESNPDTSRKGTITQYNSSNNVEAYGVSGEMAAQMIHNEIINKLKTEDAGVMTMSKSLKYENLEMPAVIVDLAFISNESDRESVMTEEFNREAAKAIHDGIIAVLNEM